MIACFALVLRRRIQVESLALRGRPVPDEPPFGGQRTRQRVEAGRRN
jgi:hypothetical protein